MLYFIVLSMLLMGCVADKAAVTPPPQILCGEIPSVIHSCLGSPKLTKQSATGNCKSLSECDRMRCVFRNSNWLTSDGKVDKEKVIKYFDDYAKENAMWSKTIDSVKQTCLVKDIPVQSAHLNCAAYDIFHCVLTGFYKNAPAEAWHQSEQCNRAKQWTQVCPFCPENCFVPSIPVGSCNACRSLPTFTKA